MAVRLLSILAFSILLTGKATADGNSALTIFIAEGAGDHTNCSEAFARSAGAGGWKADIVRFGWSHGRCKIYADQIDTAYARAQAATLADLVLTHRKAGGSPVVLVGYSAGTAVVVFAAELLPPGSLERVLLLAPSMSASYDLSGAARATCLGMDVFVNPHDCWALGVGVSLVGGADELRQRKAGGRVGFTPTPNVRQHIWDRSMRQLGYDCGHYGSYSPGHLQHVVYPLLFGQREAP